MATEYLLYNTVSHETITLCDYDDADCITALREKDFIMLDPETYGDDYDYPAIYKSPGIVWDQSAERNRNGDWMMMSREIEAEDGEASDDNGSDESLGDSVVEETDSGETDDTHGGDHSDGKDENADTTENPVSVTYHDGRRNNTGMGLYYLRGTHEIGLAPHGTESNETPSKFIPLWMSDGMDIYSDLPNFPRPGGAREGNTTGIVEHKGMHHVVFENEKGKFKKISFEVTDGIGIATSKGESKASKGWIKKIETKKSIDINGDGVFGDPADQTDGLSEGEHNNASFSNKMGSKKLLRELQSGGMVIYIRHATTEVDYADQADPDMSLDDCSTQRMLNDQGIAEAAAIGAGFEANDIVIGKVITSSYCRAKDTATIAFGKINKVEKKLNFLPFEDYTDEQLDTYHDRVAAMLSTGHKKGNKVIVGHDDPFEGTTNIYPDPQGTAYVLDPKGDSFEIIAQLQPDDWAFGADIQALG
jgi:phosphohistidine phosphatase SixA